MFDLRRFARLAAAEWVERRREWGWFLLALFVVHFVIVLLMLVNENGYRALATEGQAGLFFTGLFVTGPIFAARYFQPLARPGAELLALMRPALALEKWLLAVLVVAVAYPLAYHLVFMVCDVPAVMIARERAAVALAAELAKDNELSQYTRRALEPENFQVFHAGSLVLAGLVGTVLTLTSLQAFAVAGSLLFRRSPFLKTLLAGFLVLLALLLVTTLVDSDPSDFFDYWDSTAYAGARAIVYPLVWFGIPLLLWLCALLALREREAA